MKNKIFFTASFLFIVLMNFYSCNSPTTSTDTTTTIAPKKQATIELRLQQEPPSMMYNSWDDSWYIQGTAMVSCTNEIGGRITYLDVTWTVGNNTVASSRHEGGIIPPYGNLSIDFNSKCDSKYKPDKVTFKIAGTDNNGFSINQNRYWTWTWPNKMAIAKCP